MGDKICKVNIKKCSFILGAKIIKLIRNVELGMRNFSSSESNFSEANMRKITKCEALSNLCKRNAEVRFLFSSNYKFSHNIIRNKYTRVSEYGSIFVCNFKVIFFYKLF